jgi:hypothetical protein
MWVNAAEDGQDMEGKTTLAQIPYFKINSGFDVTMPVCHLYPINVGTHCRNLVTFYTNMWTEAKPTF